MLTLILWLLGILLLILFVPIPIKFNAIYIDNDFKVFIYKHNVFTINNLKERSPTKKDTLDKATSNNNNKKLSKKFNFQAFIAALDKNKFKPRLKLELNLDYSLDDAAYTAIIYGVLQMLFGIITNILTMAFKLDTLNLNIQPKFTNTISFFIDIKGIIYINIAKVIFILFLYIRKKTN